MVSCDVISSNLDQSFSPYLFCEGYPGSVIDILEGGVFFPQIEAGVKEEKVHRKVSMVADILIHEIEHVSGIETETLSQADIYLKTDGNLLWV